MDFSMMLARQLGLPQLLSALGLPVTPYSVFERASQWDRFADAYDVIALNVTLYVTPDALLSMITWPPMRKRSRFLPLPSVWPGLAQHLRMIICTCGVALLPTEPESVGHTAREVS